MLKKSTQIIYPASNIIRLEKNTNLRLVNFFNKIGYKKNFLKKILLWSSSLYSINNPISEEFTYSLEKNIKQNNLNSLINTIFEKSEINFKLVCVEVDKKYRKKLKKKFIFQLKYLNSIKKKGFFFKNLTHIIYKDNQRFFFNKLSHTLNILIKDFKKTELYKFKILTLKQLTKK